MECTGKIHSVNRDWRTGKIIISFELNEEPAEAINELGLLDKLSIIVKKFRQKRTKDANGMLWSCLGEIAKVLNTDKWEVYLKMLKRYGKFTYICVKPSAVESMKLQWRETEVVGNIDINGEEAVQMLCYFGSSTYNTKEFSVLLDGVISEMREMGLQPPPTREMKRVLEEWEERNQSS